MALAGSLFSTLWLTNAGHGYTFSLQHKLSSPRKESLSLRLYLGMLQPTLNLRALNFALGHVLFITLVGQEDGARVWRWR